MPILDSANSSSHSDISAARRVEFVAFLHRHPFTLDAFELGFLPGFREDCGCQETQYQNLSLPVEILDNDFRDPDLERFVDRFFEHEPQVGVIGDVDEIESITRGLAGEQPPTNPLVVLKAARWWYIHGKGSTDPAFQ